MMMSDGNVAAPSGPRPPDKRLSVVIPHYNQRDFLPRAVASVLHSEACDLEIIIVDDGSTDGSEPVLAALEATSPLIKVIRCGVNQGVVSAPNPVLPPAPPRYVNFLGADDLVLPNLYAQLLRTLGDHPTAGLGCSQLVIVDSDGSQRGIRPLMAPAFRTEYLDSRTIRQRIKRTDHWICSTSTVFRTDLLRAAGGFEPKLGVFHDIIVERLLAFEHGFVYLPGVRAIFRVDADTLSGSTLLNQNENTRQLGVARGRLTTSIVGRLAPDYPDLFARRMQFSGARLQLVSHGRNADPAVIAQVAGGTDTDVRVLTAICQIIGFGMAGRILALGWLTLRLWPFSPLSLMVHTLRNRSTSMNNRQRVADWLDQMDDARRQIIAAADTSRSPGRTP
jgi:Glycosyl transferase family 2